MPGPMENAGSTAPTLLSIQSVTKRFVSADGREVQALNDVSLDVHDGEFISIVGPSGCGKSTLLRIIAELESATTGAIRWSREQQSTGREIGFVFQEPVLLPWRNVLDNARLPLDVFREPRAEANAVVRKLLASVGLAEFEKALPKQLSGGMRQRVAIVRALSYDPPLLLMDEPFGALDLLTRDRLNDDLLAIWARTRKTIVFVTHSVEEAAYLSDRVILMSSRPGVIKREYQITLPRPRGKSTKLMPEFHQLMADLREDLQ